MDIPRYSLLIAGASAYYYARDFALQKATSAEQAALAACSVAYAAAQHTGSNAADCAYRAESLGVDVTEICYAQRWPLFPAPNKVTRLRLPEPTQVLWDRLDEADLVELTVEQLIEAHSTAPPLRWDAPAQRALAERLFLLPHLREVSRE
jgi:hypothetical protein